MALFGTVPLPTAKPLPDDCALLMQERILQGAQRLAEYADQQASVADYALRDHQQNVFADLIEYLQNETSDQSSEDRTRTFARIILPPRTGKTVIAGHLIAGTGLTSVFLVPSTALVAQTAEKLSQQLPETLIGIADGETKHLVPQGVNVVTYQTMLSFWKNKNVPRVIRESALVFADEAHHAMTSNRMDYLVNAFDPLAIRVALTATPDYSEKRMLGRYFPTLIHEVSLSEAVQLDLLAPLRVWVAEVDVDGSLVCIVKGDYQESVLGRLMTEAPFFQAALEFRYCHENHRTPALITCASRQQAYDLCRYLETHKPAGKPKPGLILGETDSSVRRRLLDDYENNFIDTLVVVGCLVEGWDSAKCKLLIDLSPSMSLVRSTQKFCRVLTLSGDSEARIYVILPRYLKQPPIMPMEILCPAFQSYDCGELIASQPTLHKQSKLTVLRHPRHHPIEKVLVKSRIVLETQVEKPRLQAENTAQVMAVLKSCPSFDPLKPPRHWEFRSMTFQHTLFTGGAGYLLRYSGYAGGTQGYEAFLARYCPEGLANQWLAQRGEMPTCTDDSQKFMDRACQGSPRNQAEMENFRFAFRAMGGREEPLGEDDTLVILERLHLRRLLEEDGLLDTDERIMIEGHFGLHGGEELSYNELAELLGRSGGWTRTVAARAYEKLRIALTEKRVPPLVPKPAEKSRSAPPELYSLVGEERFRYFVERYGVKKYEQLIKDIAALGRPWW